jgi:hypothetical protein
MSAQSTTTHPAEAEQRPKAYSYTRFSSPEQAQGDSLRRQTEAARAYAAKHKLDLDEELTFHDPGMSAYRGKTPKQVRLGVPWGRKGQDDP